MNKGERTKQEILRQSIIYSCQFGLADITIGTVSKLCNLSRTGVISHFKNKEDMQIAILGFGEALFKENVISTSYDKDPLTHVKNLLQNWINWTAQIFEQHHVSCPFIKAVIEFQNRPPSKVRSFCLEQQDRLLEYLTHRVNRCIEAKQIDSRFEAKAIAYQLYSLYLGHLYTQHSDVIKQSDLHFSSSVSKLLKSYSSQ